jgi:hypothetical protein
MMASQGQLKRRITWEIRVAAAICAYLTAKTALYLVIGPFWSGPGFEPIAAVAAFCAMLLPRSVVWNQNGVSILKTTITAALMPSITAIAAGAIVSLLNLLWYAANPSHGNLSALLTDLYMFPLSLLWAVHALSDGLVSLASLLIGLAIASIAAWRYQRLSGALGAPI